VKIEYDPEADALYIQVREADAADNIDIEDGVSVDVDAERHIVGLEILEPAAHDSSRICRALSSSDFHSNSTST